MGSARGHGPSGRVFVAIGWQTFGGNAGECVIPRRRKLIHRIGSNNYNHGLSNNCNNYDGRYVIIMIIVIAAIITMIIMIIMLIAETRLVYHFLTWFSFVFWQYFYCYCHVSFMLLTVVLCKKCKISDFLFVALLYIISFADDFFFIPVFMWSNFSIFFFVKFP